MAKSSTHGSVRLCLRQPLAHRCSRWQSQHLFQTISVAGCRAVLRRAESRAHRLFISSTRPRVCERQGLRRVHRILSLLSRRRRPWQAGMTYCRYVHLLADVCFLWRSCGSECSGQIHFLPRFFSSPAFTCCRRSFLLHELHIWLSQFIFATRVAEDDSRVVHRHHGDREPQEPSQDRRREHTPSDAEV